MTLLKTRNRLVSFRLTDEELENLRLACMMQGARNVSEFARAAVVELAGGRSQPESVLLDRFSAIELKLAEIEGNVRQNGDMLRALLKDAIAHHDRAKERAKGA